MSFARKMRRKTHKRRRSQIGLSPEEFLDSCERGLQFSNDELTAIENEIDALIEKVKAEWQEELSRQEALDALEALKELEALNA